MRYARRYAGNKGGVLYVNGMEADGPLPLRHIYRVQTKDRPDIGFDQQQAYAIPRIRTPFMLYWRTSVWRVSG